jgi:hypothetical protein
MMHAAGRQPRPTKKRDKPRPLSASAGTPPMGPAHSARPIHGRDRQPRAARILAGARIRLPGAIFCRPYRAIGGRRFSMERELELALLHTAKMIRNTPFDSSLRQTFRNKPCETQSHPYVSSASFRATVLPEPNPSSFTSFRGFRQPSPSPSPQHCRNYRQEMANRRVGNVVGRGARWVHCLRAKCRAALSPRQARLL